jgi:hypothetical protein
LLLLEKDVGLMRIPLPAQVLGLACKLALPQQSALDGSVHGAGGAAAGGAGASTTVGGLTAKNLRAVKMLFRLVHFTGNALGEGWETVIEIFDQIDHSLSRASAPAMEVAAEDVRCAMRRFTTFPVCLEDTALIFLTRAYVALSRNLIGTEQATPRWADEPAPPFPPQGASGSAGPGGGGGSGAQASATELSRSTTSAAFALRQLVRIAAFNVFRIEVVWDLLEGHLALVAGTRNTVLRQFAVHALADLVIKSLARSDDSLGVRDRIDATVGYGVSTPSAAEPGQLGVAPDLDTVFSVRAELDKLPGRRRSLAQDDFQTILVRPLQTLGTSPHLDTRENALHALYRVLQSCGHILEGGWPSVFALLQSVALKSCLGDEGGEESPGGRPQDVDQALDRSWGDTCLPLGFRSLKLIVDDFLDSVPMRHISDCIACMGAFGAQVSDVNISLTAIGMVWTVADFAKGKREPWGPQDEGIWDAILGELGRLALDARPEVRNCAINSLFSCLCGHGASFPMESWRGRVQTLLSLVQVEARNCSELISFCSCH